MSPVVPVSCFSFDLPLAFLQELPWFHSKWCHKSALMSHIAACPALSRCWCLCYQARWIQSDPSCWFWTSLGNLWGGQQFPLAFSEILYLDLFQVFSTGRKKVTNIPDLLELFLNSVSAVLHQLCCENQFLPGLGFLLFGWVGFCFLVFFLLIWGFLTGDFLYLFCE